MTLASKGPSQGQWEHKKKKKNELSKVKSSGVVSLVTTTCSVLSGRRTSRTSREHLRK